MNDKLIPSESKITVPAAQIDQELKAASRFYSDRHAANTKKGYRSDIQLFMAWCEERGINPAPKDKADQKHLPDLVATYLSALAEEGLKSASIVRKRAAIHFFYENLEINPSPTRHHKVRDTLKASNGTWGPLQVRRMPPRWIFLSS